MSNMMTYWINMEKSKERREKMESYFNKYGISNKRIEAVNGRDINNLREMGNFRNNILPNSCNLGQFGCFFSHIKVIKEFLENDKNEYCMIMEDDCDFSVIEKYNLDYNKVLEKIVKDNWREWHIIQLSVICGGNREFVTKINFKYMKWRTCFYSCLAYIINKNGARNLLNKILDENNKIKIDLVDKNFKDYVADYYIYANCKTYTYKIPLFNQDLNFESTLVSNKSTHIKAYHNVNSIVNYYDNHLKTLYPKLQ